MSPLCTQNLCIYIFNEIVYYTKPDVTTLQNLCIYIDEVSWQKVDPDAITGSVLLIIFYVENLDVGSWGVKNDV